MRRVQVDGFRLLVHIACWLPLAILIWDYANDLLTVNPIQDVTFRTGRTALVLLVLSLACTPLYTLFGFRQALRVRRAIGLYGFMYVVLHFLTFTVLDFGLDAELIFAEISEKRYQLAGFAALLILIPLAITSTKRWQKRLGRRWKTLHKLFYLAVPLGVLHFLWLVKADIREPLNFGAVVLILLALRIPAIRKTASRARTRVKRALANARSAPPKSDSEVVMTN